MLAAAQAKKKKKGLVLVVDDESSIVSSLSSVLSDEGYETIGAGDGMDALEKVESFKPDLVFLDIWMPGWDGIETLAKIKTVAPATEIIMISGHATISNALEATKRGAFDFIEKPLNIDSILFAAARALEKRGKVRQSVSDEDGEERLFTHPGIGSAVSAGRNFGQRTLKRQALLYGKGLHSGQKSGLILEPLPRGSGIHFARIGDWRTVPAYIDYVDSTGFATTIRSGVTSAGTIEHLMAALHCYRISNLLVKCNGEVPIFDGSAGEFCRIIEEIGIEEQGGEWFEFAPDKPYKLTTGEHESITVTPASELRIRYDLNYPPPVGTQRYEFTADGAATFKTEIASARTFGFMRDIEKLQKAGLAAGGRLDNFILIGDDRIVNTELRFSEELARHKILDALGDFFLLGRPIRANIHCLMTGHSDNVKCLKLLFEAAAAG